MTPAGWHVQEIPVTSRPQWMTLRGEDLCASEAGAVFPDRPELAHKYTTLRRVFMSKLYGEPAEQNMDMRRGKIMEPAVAEAIAVDCGWRPQRCGTYLRARADDPLVRMGATLDYRLRVPTLDLLVHDKTRVTAAAAGWGELSEMDLVVECKSIDMGVWEREWSQGPPAYTVVQAADQALLAGADGALVACLVENRSRDLHLYAVPRSEEFEGELIARVREFWRGFDAGEEPPVVALDNAFMSDYFEHEKDADAVIDLTEEAAVWQALVVERESLKMSQKEIQRRIDMIEATIKDRMRDAARAILPGWSITWKTDSRGVRSFKVERRAEKPNARKRR